MAEPSAFDRENIKLQPLGPPPGLLDQFNLPPAFVAFIRRNRRPLLIVAGLCATLALGISGYTTYRDHLAGKAASALDAALIAGTGSRSQLEQVVSEFASTPSAMLARIELARLDEREGQRTAAIAKYEAVKAGLGKGSLLKPLVLTKLAGLLEQDKQWDRALALVRSRDSRVRVRPPGGSGDENAGRNGGGDAAHRLVLRICAAGAGGPCRVPDRLDVLVFLGDRRGDRGRGRGPGRHSPEGKHEP